MHFLRFRRISTLIDDATKPLHSDISGHSNRRNWNPIPLPNRAIPEPRGQDLDYVNVGHSHLLHSDWAKLDKLVSGLNPYRVKHILLKVQKDFALSLEFFKWVELRNPQLLTLETNSMILHILTKNRKFKSAESILKKILLSCSVDFPSKFFDAILHSYRMCDSSPRVFDSLFKTYAHMKKFRNATDTFCRMKDYGFLPTVESCNSYMSSLISLNQAGIALAFYKEMRRCGISSNVYTINMAVGAFCKLGKLEKAVEVFGEMENMGFSPTIASYNTLIAGHINQGLLGTGMELKRTMEKNGVLPNALTYNSLIHGFCKEGKLHEAHKLFSKMKNMTVSPNTITYNTLINGYSQGGYTEIGSQLFEEMSRKGIKPDILTYNALILGLCKKGKTTKAAYLVKELDRKKLVPNSSTFAALITGQCARRNPERAFLLYMSMTKSGCNPNKQTLMLLMSSFLLNEDYDGAVKVLREMLQRSFAPDSSILCQLYNGLRRCGKDGIVMDFSKLIDGRYIVPEGSEIVSSISSPPNIEAGDNK